MVIFSALQIKKWDCFSILNEPVSSLQLMERAATICADWLLKNYEYKHSFSIFCGNGNNGGDGFVIARLLYHAGFDVAVFSDQNHKYSADALVNLERCKEISGVDILNFDQVDDYIFTENTVIVDALFGIGLNGKIEGRTAKIISVNLNIVII